MGNKKGNKLGDIATFQYVVTKTQQVIFRSNTELTEKEVIDLAEPKFKSKKYKIYKYKSKSYKYINKDYDNEYLSRFQESDKSINIVNLFYRYRAELFRKGFDCAGKLQFIRMFRKQFKSEYRDNVTHVFCRKKGGAKWN